MSCSVVLAAKQHFFWHKSTKLVRFWGQNFCIIFLISAISTYEYHVKLYWLSIMVMMTTVQKERLYKHVVDRLSNLRNNLSFLFLMCKIVLQLWLNIWSKQKSYVSQNSATGKPYSFSFSFRFQFLSFFQFPLNFYDSLPPTNSTP